MPCCCNLKRRSPQPRQQDVEAVLAVILVILVILGCFLIAAFIVSLVVARRKNRNYDLEAEEHQQRVRERGAMQALRAAREERLQALRAINMSGVDLMDGQSFERYLSVLLEHQGFSVQQVGGTGDQGVDLVAEKGALKLAVQAKRYSSVIANDAVQEVVAGMAVYGCNAAMVIANRGFTEGARKLARANDCELIDRERLARWILEFQTQKDHEWRTIEEGGVSIPLFGSTDYQRPAGHISSKICLRERGRHFSRIGKRQEGLSGGGSAEGSRRRSEKVPLA